MKALVRFLLVFVSVKLIDSKPQHLQQQEQADLDPVNEPQFEYPPKDPSKRTIGLAGRHYAYGKHVGIHPLGFKYVLGYGPVNVRYVPFVRPVAVLKPVLQHNIRPIWRPLIAPTRQYLPPAVHALKPFHHVDNEWKPIVPAAKPVIPIAPPASEVQHVHSVVEQPVPVQPVHHVQSLHPIQPAHPVQPVQHLLPAAVPAAHPAVQIVPTAPEVVPIKPVISLPAKPLLHNYYYFQTPVSKPALLPQVPLFHVTRPQLPVLPLGSTFPAPVLQPSAPGLLHFPTASAAFPVPQPAPPAIPVHHPIAVHPQPAHPVVPAQVPVHHHIAIHPQPTHSVMHTHLHPAPQPAPPQAAALPPLSIEFHGNPRLVPFHNQFSVTSVQSEVPIPAPEANVPAQPPPIIIGRQPHAQPLPQDVHTNLIPEVQHFQPQPPFNPDAAIQPGQTDLQLPMHLPDHPHFRHVQQAGHFHPAGSLEPPYPSFQHGNVLRPSISLEPPYTHGHS